MLYHKWNRIGRKTISVFIFSYIGKTYNFANSYKKIFPHERFLIGYIAEISYKIIIIISYQNLIAYISDTFIYIYIYLRKIKEIDL